MKYKDFEIEDLKTVPQTAAILHKSIPSVRIYMRQKKLRPLYIGRTPYFTMAELKRFVLEG